MPIPAAISTIFTSCLVQTRNCKVRTLGRTLFHCSLAGIIQVNLAANSHVMIDREREREYEFTLMHKIRYGIPLGLAAPTFLTSFMIGRSGTRSLNRTNGSSCIRAPGRLACSKVSECMDAWMLPVQFWCETKNLI